MLLKEYLSKCKLFPLMDVSQLNVIGDNLDTILRIQQGLRTCGSAIMSIVADVNNITIEEQTEIAQVVYIMNKEKWDNLINFASQEIGYYDNVQTTERDYGKITDTKLGGTNTVNDTDKIAGFDSTDFVDKDNSVKGTTFGKTTNKSDSGKDTVTVKKQSKQKERLVDYTMTFWNKYGLTRTIISDTAKCITLPIYNLY